MPDNDFTLSAFIHIAVVDMIRECQAHLSANNLQAVKHRLDLIEEALRGNQDDR